MSHPDVEARVGAHQIFSALLIPSSNHIRRGVASLRSSSLHQLRRWHSNTASASITALLEKLRREKDGFKLEKHGNNVHDDLKERDMVEEDWKQGRVNKNSPNFYKISSIVDRTAVSISLSEAVRRNFNSRKGLLLSGDVACLHFIKFLTKSCL